MNKAFKVKVNNIMTVEKNVVDPASRDSDQIVYTTYLKAYEPAFNANLSLEENQKILERFKKENEGLIGMGYTFVCYNDNDELVELYSGIKVIPVKSKACPSLSLEKHYTIDNVIDDQKLYVPIDCLEETKPEDFLDIIAIDKGIIEPLENRLELVKNLYGKNKQYKK